MFSYFLIITDKVGCIEESVAKFYVALYVHIRELSQWQRRR